MGYGGSREDAGKTIGKSGDGGLDGVINEDRLGLDVVYIQAKRWESSVGRPVVQAFAGSLARLPPVSLATRPERLQLRARTSIRATFHEWDAPLWTFG